MKTFVGRISPFRQRGLVRPTYSDPLYTTNWQRNGFGLYQTPDTATGTFGIAGANTPRFTTTRYDAGLGQYADLGLLLENQRLNYVQNPRIEGGTSGDLAAGGVLPTGMSWIGLAGVTATYTRLNAPQGAFLRLALAGTPTASGVAALLFENVGLTGMALNDPSMFSFYGRRRAGALTNIQLLSWGPIKDSTAAIVVDTQVDETANLTAYFKRFYNKSVAPAAGSAPFSRPQVAAIFAMVNGQPVNCTFEFMFPGLEAAAYALSPALPPVGTPGISTRPQDIATIPTASWYKKRPFSFLFTAKRSFLAPDTLCGLFALDDNTFNNRLYCYVNQNTSDLVMQAAIAGTYNGPLLAGTYTLDTQFKLALTVDGTNVRASMNGAAVSVLPLPFTLTSPTMFSLGSLGPGPTGTNSWNGEISVADYLPYPLTDVQLRAAST